MGLFSGLLGGGSSNKASKELIQKIEALYKQPAPEVDIRNTDYAGADMSNGRLTAVRSKSLGNTFNDFNHLISKTGRSALKLNQRGLATEFFNQIDALASRRDADQMNSLESRLFNKSGINQGTANQVADFRNQLEQGRQQRVFQATGAAQNFTSNLFNQFLGLTKGRADLAESEYEPMKIAAMFANPQLAARTDMARLLGDAYGIGAGNKADSGANTGSLIDSGIQFASLFAGG